MTDHATARLGDTGRYGYEAELVWSGFNVEHRQHAVMVLASIFPNLPVRASEVELIEPVGAGTWMVTLPEQVANEVDAGVDFGWTEAAPVSYGTGEELLSIFVPGSPV